MSTITQATVTQRSKTSDLVAPGAVAQAIAGVPAEFRAWVDGRFAGWTAIDVKGTDGKWSPAAAGAAGNATLQGIVRLVPKAGRYRVRANPIAGTGPQPASAPPVVEFDAVAEPEARVRYPLQLMLAIVDRQAPDTLTLAALKAKLAPLHCTRIRTWMNINGQGGWLSLIRAAGFDTLALWTWQEAPGHAANHDAAAYLRGLDAAVARLGPRDVVHIGNEVWQIRKYRPGNLTNDAAGMAVVRDQYLAPLRDRIGAARVLPPSLLPEMDGDCSMVKRCRDAGLYDPKLVAGCPVDLYYRESWSAQRIADHLGRYREIAGVPLWVPEFGANGTAPGQQSGECLRQLDGIQQEVEGPIAPFNFIAGGKWDASYTPTIGTDGAVLNQPYLDALAARAIA